MAERQVELAVDSYNKNLVGLGQVRTAGEMVQTIVRPQEVIAAVQSLAQAYSDYFAAIADSNRAQFRLYRAMGEPAQTLQQRIETNGGVVPPTPDAPAKAPSSPARPTSPVAPPPAPAAHGVNYEASFSVHDRQPAE